MNKIMLLAALSLLATPIAPTYLPMTDCISGTSSYGSYGGQESNLSTYYAQFGVNILINYPQAYCYHFFGANFLYEIDPGQVDADLKVFATYTCSEPGTWPTIDPSAAGQVTLSPLTEYVVDPSGTDSSSPPCGYAVYFLWTGSGTVSIGIYTGLPTPTDLGDCATLTTTSNGQETTPTDYISQGYLGGFSTTLGARTLNAYYYCSHFHTSDFKLTTPIPNSEFDVVSNFKANYFPSTLSGGSCVADPTKSVTTTGSTALTVGTEYTPSFDGSGTSSDPCGYLVYYLWQGTNDGVVFNVYEGKVQSLGDCLKLTTTANGSFKKEKTVKGYKYKSLVTLGEGTSGQEYSCYHFFVATFETKVNTPASSSDLTSDLTMDYYKGSLKSGKCIAPTVFTTSTGVITSGKVYKTSKTECGYYVIYTWTGTHGGITFTIQSN